MTDELGGEPEPRADERVDPSSGDGPVSMKFRVFVAMVALLMMAGIVASFLVRPDAEQRSAAGSPRATANAADADVDEELRDVRELRVDRGSIEMPAGWTGDPAESTPANAAFQHRDGRLVTVSIAEFDGNGPRSDRALVEEIDAIEESIADAEPGAVLELDDPLVDADGAVRRAYLYGTMSRGDVRNRLRIALSFDRGVGRMLFVSMFVADPEVPDADVEQELLDLVSWLEVDAFDPDVSFELAPFS